MWRARDEDRGFQLYQSDPSGNYGGWKATAIGANKQAAQNLLKQDYADDITLDKSIKLVIKVRQCPFRLQLRPLANRVTCPQRR